MAENKINLLVIEDEEFDLRRIENTLRPYAKKISIASAVSNGTDSVALLKNKPDFYDVVIMDFQIAGGLMGERLIEAIKKIDETIQIIIVTKMTINQTDFEFANKLLEAGAFWYCTKYPSDIDKYIYQPTDFVLSIINAYEKRLLEKRSRRSISRLEKNAESLLNSRKIIGKSEQMKTVRELVERFGKSPANIMLYGDSGVGKELVATHIHYLSERRHENYVTINCASIPHELIESELFGFEKGSFTGADQAKEGLFEKADNGTVFLDEVGELPLSAQTKLLRVLESGEIDKIGRKDKKTVDVRVIGATNRNLEELVKEKKFRDDLYYRLNVLRIDIPNLRERREDISEMVEHFITQYSNEMGITHPIVKESAMEILTNYDWLGNVRQVKNVVQRLLLSESTVIESESVKWALGIDKQIDEISDTAIRFDESNIRTLKDVEYDLKSEYIRFVRSKSDSDAEAARKLGLAPPNYHRLCKELGIK